MSRPTKIILPQYRPYTCNDCPLCGIRPSEEMEKLPAGSKWTRWCLWQERAISGRGSKQPNARNRCKPKEYNIMFHRNQGFYPISANRVQKYQIQQQQIIFPPDYASKKE